jgi:hypothetical protein
MKCLSTRGKTVGAELKVYLAGTAYDPCIKGEMSCS